MTGEGSCAQAGTTDDNAFYCLKNLKNLYLHPMKLELKSHIFKNNQKLEELTLFTNIVIIKPVFTNSSAELINDNTLSRQCGLKYTNESHQTECTLSSKSFTSIKLNKNSL